MGTKVILLGLLITAIALAPSPAPGQTPHSQKAIDANTQRELETLATTDSTGRNEPLSAHQKLSIVQVNFAKAKSDAAELATLARELREELNKPNVDVLSLEVASRAEKIGKLAKKIREETRAY